MKNDQIGRHVRGLLDRWAEGIARGDHAAVGELFADDALFQGFGDEPVTGPRGVSAYYAAQPTGLRAEHEIVDIRVLGPDAAVAFASVRFHRPDGPVDAYLTVVVTGPRIVHYHVSRRAA